MNHSHHRRVTGALVAIAAGTLLLAACGSSGSSDSAASSDAAPAGESCTVKVGVATGQTGGLAYVDVPSLEGFDIWVDEVNAAGGIDGKFRVETIVKDTRSDAAQSATVAAELLGEGISFLITPGDADPSIAAGQLAQEAQVPAMSWFGSSPVLPVAVGDFMFSNAFGDNAQARVLANYATQQGYTTAYTLGSPDSAYTSNLPRYFKEAFTSNGGTVVGEGTYTMGQPNFNVIADEIKALNPAPDVIMTPAYEPDFPTFLKAIRGAGINTPVLGTDGIDSPTTLALGETAEGVVYTTAGVLANEGPMGEFFTKYNAKYGKDPEAIFAVTGYELGNVLNAAVTNAQSCDPVAIKDAITNLEGVQGITGTISFKGGDRMAIREIALIKVTGGERSLVEVVIVDPATVPAA
ncbi:MAG: ABC transporter substrate-binding protein [Actinobacteria bacterium]|nr:ABC transporter substrate-binding protein [Actinomycetota bacterium]